MLSLLAAESGAGNTLVGVRGLLDDDLLVGGLAGAAADGDEPEEARGNGEGNAEPESGEHLGAEGGLDVVGLEDRLEDTSKRGVDGSYGDGSGEHEDGLSLDWPLVNAAE